MFQLCEVDILLQHTKIQNLNKKHKMQRPEPYSIIAFKLLSPVLVCLRVACPFCHLTAGTCSDVQDHILKQIDIAYGGGMTYVDYNSLFLLRFYVQNLSKSMQLCVAILQDLLSVFQYLVLSAGPVSKICTDVGLFSRR